MKKYFNGVMRTIDYFGQPVQITFNKEKKFTTVWGGMVSTIIYALTLVLTIKAGSNLFNKAFPKTSMTSQYLINSPIFNLTSLDMVFSAYLLSRQFVPFNDPSIFTMELSQFVVKRESDGSQSVNYVPLKQVNCTNYLEHFKLKGFEEDFKKSSLAFGTCFNISQPDLLIGGNFVSDYFSNILFRVKKCVNSTESPVKCQPESVITDKLQGAYFQFYYIDNNIDINNYDDPFIEYFTRYFILLDPYATKFVDVYFKTVNLTTDAGIIFEEEEYEETVVFDYYREQIDTSLTENKIIEFYINSSNNYVKYTRIYLKFQEYAATIGGLLKVMLIGGWFLTNVFNNHKMYEIMFGSLFYFKGSPKTSTARKSKIIDDFSRTKQFFHELSKLNLPSQSRAPNMNNLPNNMNSQNHLNSKNQLSNNFVMTPNSRKDPALFNDITNNKNFDNFDINKEIELYKNEINTRVKLSVVSIIKMYFCGCCSPKQAKKRKYFNFAYNKLQKYLDYLEIVKTLQQFHRIKKVLFTKTQENIFSFYNRPVISESKISLKTRDSSTSFGQNEYVNLYKYYVKAKNKEGSNKIYKRLLRVMDGDIKHIFDKVYHDA